MPRGSVIAGSIVDPFGRPRPQIRVQVLQYRTQGGQRRLTQAGTGSFATDDRGAFRIYGLPAGEFIVAVVPQNTSADVRMITSDELRLANTPGATALQPGPTIGFSPVYFPGVSDIAMATTITLGAGEERTGLDLLLQPVPTARIEGVLLAPDGRPAPQAQVTLVGEERMRPGALAPDMGLSFDNARIDATTGKFTFTGVPPGHYMLTAQARIRNAGAPLPTPVAPVAPAGAAPPLPMPMPQPATLWAMTPIDVAGGDISNLTINLQPGLSISGRVVFEASGPAPPVETSRTRLSLSHAGPALFDMGLPNTVATADGTFVINGVVPGQYRLSGSAPSRPGPQGGPWVLKSIVAHGHDTLDAGFEVPGSDVTGVVVTFTDRVTDLSGTLFDENGAPTRELSVLCFSTDRTFWTPQSRRVRIVRPQADGKFRFNQWVPGEYYLVAVMDGDQIDLGDRNGLEQIAAVALKVTLAEGERKVQDLKLSR
jgi:hypothetical protein